MLLAFIAWGAFGTVAFAHRHAEERRAQLLGDSLQQLLTSGRCVWIPPEPAATSPPAYAIWSEEVAQCVAELARTNTSFTVVDTTTTVADVVWLAVATERGDATFSWGVKSGYYAFRAGPPGHDTIALAAPLLLVPRVIKHEIMHIKVDSPREDVWLGHG